MIGRWEEYGEASDLSVGNTKSIVCWATEDGRLLYDRNGFHVEK
jgi:hypothetical protein